MLRFSAILMVIVMGAAFANDAQAQCHGGGYGYSAYRVGYVAPAVAVAPVYTVARPVYPVYTHTVGYAPAYGYHAAYRPYYGGYYGGYGYGYGGPGYVYRRGYGRRGVYVGFGY